MAEATGTIEPTPPSTLMDRIYNYMNQDYNLRDELQLNSRKQPEQELKPAMNPLLQGIFNLLGGGLEGAIPNDPVIESLVKGGQFATELIKDPLNFTLAGKGFAGAKMALTPFMIARRKEIQQTLKTFDKDPILKGNESVRTSLKKELDRINKTEAEDLRIAKQYDEFVKDPTKFGKSQPTKEVADATSKIGRNSITKNIKSSSLIDEGASEAKEEIVKQIGPDLFNFGLGSLQANKQGRKLDISDFQKLLTPPQMRMMDDMADSQNLFRVPASERLFNKKYNTLEPSMTGVDEYEAMIEALRNM